MPTKLLRQIRNTIPELRKSEKLVADFVLNDPKSVITMKTAEASSAMGISEPTLIRFCKALGFSGYQEFKINLSQQLAADDFRNSGMVFRICRNNFVGIRLEYPS